MSAERAPKIGDPAPDFELETDTTGTVRLADYAGKHVVLYFYPRDNTAGCTKQAVAFSEAADAFAARNAEIVGVSKDSVASHEKFRKKHALTITLGSDADGSVCKSYGVWVEKNMYGKTHMGIERSTFLIGPDGRVSGVWRKVSVPGHVETVLEAVKT